MTATLTTSDAIIKKRYQSGKVPQALYKRVHCKLYSMIEQDTDFTGEPWHLALQNENPQNAGGNFGIAQNVATPGSYKGFDITSVQMFSLARITGQAMRKVEGNLGAMLDLWKNEMDGAAMTAIHDHEVTLHGNQTGVRGTVLSGGAGTTLTLSEPTDIAKFFLGMKVVAVNSATSLAPTITTSNASAPDATGSNCPKVTAINRKNGTITISAAFNADVTGQFLTRAGENAAGGVAAVYGGVKSFIAYDGTTLPGTLYGLNRDSDPTRLAGSIINGAGSSIEDILVDGSAEVAQQGGMQPNVALMNPKRLARLRKELSAKVVYERKNLDSKIAGVSWDSVTIYGDDGIISCVADPFLSEPDAELLYMDSWFMKSAGAAPRILDFDSNTYLRVSTADEYEVRWGSYVAAGCNSPVSNVRYTNFGR